MPRRTSSEPTDDPSFWPVKRTVSAGGVVLRHAPEGPEVALIRRRTLKGDTVWGLPKGGPEAGETIRDTALREVREETGLEAEISAELPEMTYWFTWPPERVRYRKTVHMFLMWARGGDPSRHDDEVEEVRFFPIPDAIDAVPHESERTVLRRAAQLAGSR